MRDSLFGIQRCSQLLGNQQTPDHKLVDFESLDAGATDRQPTNRESPDRQGSNGNGSKRQCADSLCPDKARCRTVGKPGLGIGTSVVRDAWTALT
jgi:hypothetical protein